jgi:hypothetical protein
MNDYVGPTRLPAAGAWAETRDLVEVARFTPHVARVVPERLTGPGPDATMGG